MNPVTKNKNALFEKLVTQVKTTITDKPSPIQSGENLEVTDKYEIPDVDILKTNVSRTHIFKNLNVDSDNSYQYKLGALTNDINVNYKGNVYICMYTVITSSVQPFLLYLLHNDKDVMKLPYIKANTHNLVSDIEKKISFITNNSESTYKGHLLFNNEMYVFYNLEDNIFSTELLTRKDTWWFSLMTEICYMKKIMNFKIDNRVTNLFANNQYLCKLYDMNHNVFMSPHPMYYGSNMEYIEHIIGLGVTKNAYNADFGPFFNFGSYEIGCRYGGWTLRYKPFTGNKLIANFESKDVILTDNDFGRYAFGGIVRFAVFIGNHKTFLNRPHDPEDNSRYADGANVVKEKRKIIDVRGSWAKHYDSIHKGQLGIHQYNVVEQKGYIFVVKKFNQQYPLTYHRLDKTNMPAMYDPTLTYQIE
tara:strand:- start:937 stop:2190 length:1254 start_codon:yes stop_codon:yes gene_type:complete